MTSEERALLRLLADAIIMISGGSHSRDECNIVTQIRRAMQAMEEKKHGPAALRCDATGEYCLTPQACWSISGCWDVQCQVPLVVVGV